MQGCAILTFLFFITPMAAIIRFLTVGSCPFRAASSFKSRTGFEESLDEARDDTNPCVSLICGISIEVGDEKEQPLATTTSVGALLCGNGMLRSVPIFDADILFGVKADFDIWVALEFTGERLHMNLVSYSVPVDDIFPI